MKVDFKYEKAEHGERGAFRAPVPGVVAKIFAFDGAFSVIDLSVLGVGVNIANTHDFRIGMEVSAELLSINQKPIIRFIGRVTRLDKEASSMGLEFVNLAPSQEALLDKLILEIQKKEINKQKGLPAPA